MNWQVVVTNFMIRSNNYSLLVLKKLIEMNVGWASAVSSGFDGEITPKSHAEVSRRSLAERPRPEPPNG